MKVSGDEIAGIVDIFGALTRQELGQALVELAFKRGEEREPSSFDAEIDEAIDTYQLLGLDGDAVDPSVNETALVPGPAAFPTLPDQAEDLRHILDVPERTVDDNRAGEIAADRLHEEAVIAIRTGDHDELRRLIDLSYDIELWAPVSLSETRRRMEDEL